MDAFGRKEAWKTRRGWNGNFSRRQIDVMLKDGSEGFAVIQKIKGARLSGIVEQLVAVSSRCKSEVIVLASSPLVVEIDCPAMHLKEVEGDVGGGVNLQGLEVSASVDVVLESEGVDLLLPPQTVYRLLGNGSHEVLDLSDELDQVGDRCLCGLGQYVSHEDHYFVGGGGVEAVLDHVGSFELVLSEEALEDLLDDFVISWGKGLRRGRRWLSCELGCLQGRRGGVKSRSHDEQDCSSGQHMTLHRDLQSNTHLTLSLSSHRTITLVYVSAHPFPPLHHSLSFLCAKYTNNN